MEGKKIIGKRGGKRKGNESRARVKYACFIRCNIFQTFLNAYEGNIFVLRSLHFIPIQRVIMSYYDENKFFITYYDDTGVLIKRISEQELIIENAC